MAFKTEKISTDMPLQGFRLQKSGNPHEYWAAVCKKDNFQWITVELGWPAPYYPLATHDIFEIGAYWEGAIFYIQAVLGFTRIDDFLTTLRTPPRDSERWQIFLHIWNSDGQLDTLVAFLVRTMLRDSDQYKLKTQDKWYWTRWIKAFENTNREQWVAKGKPPDPFFSNKGNPLHLGMILSHVDADEKLFSP